MGWLTTAGGAVATLHGLLYYLTPVLAYFEIKNTGRIRLLVFVALLLVITLPSQWLFLGDCPLTLLEVALKGTGGDNSQLLQHRATIEMLTIGMTPLQIYHTLIWETGVYLLVLGAGMIAASLVIDAWWQRRRKRM